MSELKNILIQKQKDLQKKIKPYYQLLKDLDEVNKALDAL